MNDLNILACQIDIPAMTTAAERNAHLAATATKIDAQLTAKSADLVVLPELASIDYSRGSFDHLDTLAEPFDGVSFQTWSALAQKHACHILYNFARTDGTKLYISAAVVDPSGTLIGHYDKLHLCNYGAGIEKDYFTKGDHLFTFTVNDFTLAPIICYDIRIPELSRSLTLDHKVDAILHCGAYYRDESFATWHPFATTRALENQIYLFSLNRAGTQYGNSILCRPWMDENTPPSRLPPHAEHFAHLTLQKSEITAARKTYTFLKDRFNDYGAL
jgi:nitrilase